MLKPYLSKIITHQDLTRSEAYEAMQVIMNGEATPAQIASFLTGLRMKGETAEEIVGCAQVMREKASRLNISDTALVDTCGTGGDGGNTFNISTTTAILCAAGDIKIAKHGNRAVSSRSGSADVLEALGIDINLTEQDAKNMLDETNLCFLFAPLFHQAMKHAVHPRREIGFRTIFNLLGPLTNPAGAKRQLLGVFSPDYCERIAVALKELGSKRFFVVSSYDNLDEISINSPTKIIELKEDQLIQFDLQPADLGFPHYDAEQLKGGTAEENAQIVEGIFTREIMGAKRDIVILNSAAVFYVADAVSSLEEGIKLAQKIIDEGYAAEKLQQLKKRKIKFLNESFRG